MLWYLQGKGAEGGCKRMSGEVGWLGGAVWLFFFTPFLVRKDTFEGSRTHCLHVIGNVKDGFVSLVDKNE